MAEKTEKPVRSAFVGLIDDDEDTETVVTSTAAASEPGDGKTGDSKDGAESAGQKKSEKAPVAEKSKGLDSMKKSTKKESTPKKTVKKEEKTIETMDPSSVEGKLLFEHGIDMRGGIEDNLDFATFRKIVGTAWKNELVGDSSVPQRVSVKNMEFIKLIADTNKISLTQALNNILAYTKYEFSDYFKKLQKEREQIEL